MRVIRQLATAVILSAFFTLSSSPAAAAIVTVSASAFAPGTDISNATPGLTLTAVSKDEMAAGTVTQHVTTVPCGDSFFITCAANPNVFATAGTGNPGWAIEEPGLLCLQNNMFGACNQTGPFNGFSVMKVSLLNPTNFVQVTGQLDDDALGLWAFNSSGQLLGSCTGYFTSAGNPCFTRTLGDGACHQRCEGTAMFSSGSEDIAYFYAAGNGSNDRVDSVTVNMVSVPEPGTLALLAGMLAAIGLIYQMKGRRVAARAV